MRASPVDRQWSAPGQASPMTSFSLLSDGKDREGGQPRAGLVRQSELVPDAGPCDQDGDWSPIGLPCQLGNTTKVPTKKRTICSAHPMGFTALLDPESL